MAEPRLAPVVEEVRARLAGVAPSPSEAETVAVVQGVIAAVAPLLDPVAHEQVLTEVVACLRGLGPLDELLADDDVSDVLVNGDGRVWIERSGRLAPAEVTVSPELRSTLLERIVNPLGLRVDRARPIVDARLPDGTRVHAVVPPIAVDGPCLSLRRFGAVVRPVDAYCEPEVAALLRAAVTERCNLLVSGGTGAGKTSFLNALAGSIGGEERLITVEDAAELRLGHVDLVRLEARPPNAEGVGEVTVRELVRTALRMRPDRIIVGEVRGPEALDMLQAMNTGHEGSLSTCHANGPTDALRRLETMVLSAGVALPSAAVRDQIAAALDLVVQVARTEWGDRRITAVDEVVPVDPADPHPVLRTRRLADREHGIVAAPDRPSRRHPGRAWWSPCG